MNIYYDIKYKNYKITDKKFFLSHEVSTTKFTLEKKENILSGENTTITIRMNKEIFYSPNIESVKYGVQYSSISFDSNSNYVFQEIEKNNFINFITASIYIQKGFYYGIKQICRKQWKYCRSPDCQNLNEVYDITSNLPDVGFKFNKNYITLSNSTDERVNEQVNKLRIQKTKEGKDEIDYLVYIRSHEGINFLEIIIYPESD